MVTGVSRKAMGAFGALGGLVLVDPQGHIVLFAKLIVGKGAKLIPQCLLFGFLGAIGHDGSSFRNVLEHSIVPRMSSHTLYHKKHFFSSGERQTEKCWKKLLFLL
jgi:hypothetical protein